VQENGRSDPATKNVTGVIFTLVFEFVMGCTLHRNTGIMNYRIVRTRKMRDKRTERQGLEVTCYSGPGRRPVWDIYECCMDPCVHQMR
jgi:hypothetical protein